MFHSYHHKCWTVAVLQFCFLRSSALLDKTKQDDFLLKIKKGGSIKTVLQIWGQEKSKVTFDLIFFYFVRIICVQSENETNGAEEVTFVML